MYGERERVLLERERVLLEKVFLKSLGCAAVEPMPRAGSGHTARVGLGGFKVLCERNSGEATGNIPLHHP